MSTDQQSAGALRAGRGGLLLLSTDAAESALAASSGADGVAVFTAGAIHLADGETLVVRAANGGPVRVVTEVLEVGAGARVVLETYTELHAARATFGADSRVELVGTDSAGGAPGGNGPNGSRSGDVNGGRGGNGGDGVVGGDGPGGIVASGELDGILTIVAGGGNGGAGGPGGRGGNGEIGYGEHARVGRGGDGGNGGDGQPGGEGGTVVISIGTLKPGSTIQPVAKVAVGGAPGTGGDGGGPGYTGTVWGSRGADGKRGADGRPPQFLIRPAP